MKQPSRSRVHGGKIWWSEGKKEKLFIVLLSLPFHPPAQQFPSFCSLPHFFIVIQHSFLLHFHFYDSPFPRWERQGILKCESRLMSDSKPSSAANMMGMAHDVVNAKTMESCRVALIQRNKWKGIKVKLLLCRRRERLKGGEGIVVLIKKMAHNKLQKVWWCWEG